MNKFTALQEFLAGQSPNLSLTVFALNLIVTFILSYLLSKYYIKYGKSLSNRTLFSQNFIMLSLTTMIIISVVKTSLALSLGLVGALSIVRYRAAIKEPEELSFLFFAIAIGVGLGANQIGIILIGYTIVMTLLLIRNYTSLTISQHNLYLTVSGKGSDSSVLNQIVEAVKENSNMVSMKRLDDDSESLEVTFLVELADFEQLRTVKDRLRAIDNSLHISFLDNKGIM